MSLRHGLLGLLAEGPASGYDLTRRFEQVLGAVWPAGHPQIYGELSRLASDGLIEIDSEGPRGRKAYRITESGLTEIRRWLRDSSEVDHTTRLQSLLRSFFFWLMEPADLNDHLMREADFFAAAAGRYRTYADAADRAEGIDTPQQRSQRIAIEGGARLYEALAAWARWAADRTELTGDRRRPL
ncbi:PadR family transcriptional regulator [Parafrankia sp. FMc2]|uniref:PadR family transcriptional regulator n=1 Tax=Parafrankia sp. FMc2 TaxID=3233196 RepID=UPI0034D68290